MGFQITSGDTGFFGALLIGIGVIGAAFILIFYLALVRRAHDDVVEDSDHDIEA